uniref:CW domain-containing protein n=1 Tax=Caenorhabditis tropicalis TaxID=1561998 RepID=A0A1I7UWN8_9PELO
MEFDACVDYCNNNLDTCMAVYSEQGSSDCQIFEKGQLASVTETDESTGGKMNTTNYVTCPLNPEENSMTVVLTAPTFLTKSQATSMCSSDYSGSISGLENVDEYNHLVDTVLPILEQDIPSLSPYIAAGFWIDGFRKTACQSNAPASCNGTDVSF